MNCEEEKVKYLNNPTLSKLLREAEDLCEELDKPIDYRKIRVSTDYGTNVVLYCDENK